jgi:hypothetical protein
MRVSRGRTKQMENPVHFKQEESGVIGEGKVNQIVKPSQGQI